MSESPLPGPMASGLPIAVLILGMHRSGTSAAAGAISRLGVSLGSRLLDPGPDNVRGYFEHRDAVRIDEDLQRALGMDWDDPRALPHDWVASPAADHARNEIRALIASEFERCPIWALKDPRMCRTLPVWRREIEDASVRPVALFVLRHPDEIAASLLARDALSSASAYCLCIRHLLDAEFGSRGMPRAVVRYETLIEDPVAAFDQVATELGLAWPRRPSDAAAALGGFLDTNERHHVRKPPDREPAADRDVPFRDDALELHRLLGSDPDPASVDAFRRGFEEGLGRMRFGIGLFEDEWRLRAVARSKFIERHAGMDKEVRDRLRTAEELALRRMSETHELDRAFRNAEAVALERLAQLSALDQAHAQAERLAMDRLAELEQLDRAYREAAQLALERLDALNRHSERSVQVEREVAALRTALASIKSSWRWRLTHPLQSTAASKDEEPRGGG